MGAPVLIFTGGGNRRMSQMAVDAGFEFGARLPASVRLPVYFADQDWRAPDRGAYMRALAEQRPHMATVLDWERESQLAEVLDWAEEAAQYVQEVVLIPKVVGGVARLPRWIGGRRVLLGYPLNNKFSGTEVPLWECFGWPVHLLGGAPHRQMEVWRYLQGNAEVVSADGNMAQKMAVKWCQFWTPGDSRQANNRWWPRLWEADGTRWGHDAPYESFRRSCANIMQAWRQLCGVNVPVGT